MALGSSYLKPSQTPYVSSSSSSSSSSSPMKLKTLIQTFIISHVCRFFHELSKATSILVKSIKQKQYNFSLYPKRVSKKQKKIIFGSFRLHYNWCSSHVVPVSLPVRMRLPEELSGAHLHQDSTWNSAFSTSPLHKEARNEDDDGDDSLVNGGGNESQLSGYRQWLEEEKVEDEDKEEKEMNEIDKLADMFIASCHEKFRLEKVESLRRFQEMLARGL